MGRLFVDPQRLVEEIVVIADEDHRYVTRVLRLVAGDPVVMFDGAGQEANGRIVRIGPRALEIRVEERRTVEQVIRPVVTVIQALAKNDKLDMVVQKATELGVARIIPVTSERSVPRLEAMRALGRRARWQKIAREAARQCGRADVPDIEPVTVLETALSATPREALKLFFWEGARQQGLRQLLPEVPPRDIALAIGPEGGFSTREVDAAKAAGFVAAGLGPRVLRTETVALTALAILGYALGDLG